MVWLLTDDLDGGLAGALPGFVDGADGVSATVLLSQLHDV